MKNDKKLIVGLLIFVVCICSVLIIQNNNLKKKCTVCFSTTESQETFCENTQENTYISDTTQIAKKTTKFPCDINSISKEVLMEIDGIGSNTAEKIIAYRDNINGFKNLDELLNIDGIGNATCKKLKNYLYISSTQTEEVENIAQTSEITTIVTATVTATETTTVYTTTTKETEPLIIEQVTQYPININTAPQKLLMELPGIGEVKSAAIIAFRETYGYFNHSDEIMNVKGIGQKTYDKMKNLITTGTSQSNVPSFLEQDIIIEVTTAPTPNEVVIITPTETEETTTTEILKLVNINTATKEELIANLSLTSDEAEKIITHRENTGHGFANTEELLMFISNSKYNSIINMITI